MNDLEVKNVDWATSREALLSIRFEVFVEEQGVPREMEEDAADPEGLHLLAVLPGSGPVGTGRLLPDGHIGRMAVRAPFRRQGIGSTLLRTLIQEAKQADISTVYLHAQCDAAGFYRGHGFVPEGDVFEEAGIPHQRMYLKLGTPV